MKWTIIQLQKFRDDELVIDQTVDVAEELKQRDPEIRGASPIRVSGKAEVDSKEITFHLHMTGNLILPCARTLVDVEYPIDIQSTETFKLSPLDTGNAELDGIHEPQGGIVDLLPIIQELLLLEVPIQVFSEEALNVEPQLRGQDWAVMTEEQYKHEQQKERIDPRLAGLADLLKDKKE